MDKIGSPLKYIDYAIISNDQNPEYVNLFPYIRKRWNQLGIKTIYVDVKIRTELEYDQFGTISIRHRNDKFGNIVLKLEIPKSPRILHRYFDVMIARFYVATLEEFRTNRIIIADGDLFPINKKYIYQPSFTRDMEDCIGYNNMKSLITTNMYADGTPLATYMYGYGEAFYTMMGYPKSIEDVYRYAESLAWKYAKIYANDEHIINMMIKHAVPDIALFQIANRKWVEQSQEMNNLYDYQLDLLQGWQDLCPFLEFHNMRASTMTEERWEKLFSLLEEYDKYDITPNNWFYETINNPWRDTIITKEGYLILGDEYES